MAPTVRQVLALPELRHGRPVLLAGADRIDRAVRWVHVSELPDIAPLLRGGELILTTGIALSQNEHYLVRYIDELAGADASGLVIELGRRFAELPEAMVRRSEQHQLPLVALRREVPFVRITEAVHSIIVDAQVKQLQDAETVHRRFTELALEGAGADRILTNVWELTGRPVVLENLAHQVLGWASGAVPIGELLDDWESRSRFVRLDTRTQVVHMPDPWLVTRVGARGSHWGRLFLRLDGEPSSLDSIVLERGAGTLAMNRLMEREEASLERITHRALIDDIRSGHAVSDEETALRAAALGVPLTQRRLVAAAAVVSAPPAAGYGPGAQLRDAAETIATVTRDAGVPALVGGFGQGEIAMVLTLPVGARPVADLLTGVMQRIRDELGRAIHDAQVSLAVGSAVDHVAGLRRSLLEAQQVAQAAPGLPDGKPYYQLSDIRIRGLLYLIRADPRLQTFVEQELGALLMHDSAHGTDLVQTLAGYLDAGRNKSAAAAAVGLSRPAFYQRLARIERILGTELEDVEACLSLHVAVLALDALRHAPRLTTTTPAAGPDTIKRPAQAINSAQNRERIAR
jgi:PucR family transcriptional regulator, purine catabolism regulatory protein